MLLHLILASSAAGEATRGYLHGGLLIDFVGQKSPVGRWKLMGIDFLVLTLQILMLGITRTSRAIDTDSERSGIVGEVTDDQRQDHDSEERGILRQPAQDPSAVGAFEMQDLRHISEQTAGDGDAERDELLWQPDGIEARHQHHLDHYYAGECMIANLHIVETIRAQWQAGGVSAENSRSSASGVQAAVVAAAAGRTLTYRLNEGIQNSQ